jgi:hypothetical protein
MHNLGSFTNYLDVLVQMEVVEVVGQKGDEWIEFRRPLRELLADADRMGVFSDTEGLSLQSAACAITSMLLLERGLPFSEAEFAGVASVLNGALVSVVGAGQAGVDLVGTPAQAVAEAPRGPWEAPGDSGDLTRGGT